MVDERLRQALEQWKAEAAHSGGEERGEPAATQWKEAERREWQRGYQAGRNWALEEAEAGYLHPLEVSTGRAATVRMLLEHAPQVFSGICRGRSRAFIRGFVQGVADFWREIKDRL